MSYSYIFIRNYTNLIYTKYTKVAVSDFGRRVWKLETQTNTTPLVFSPNPCHKSTLTRLGLSNASARLGLSEFTSQMIDRQVDPRLFVLIGWMLFCTLYRVPQGFS